MNVSNLVNVLWLAQPLLKIAILVVMYRRKLHLRYPLFFSFLAYGIGKTALLYGVHTSYRVYFYAYWATEAVEALLALGVIYEFFTSMFRRYHALRDFGTMLFRWALVMAGMMAALLMFTGINPSTRTVVGTVTNLDRSVSVLLCGMLLFVILFSPYLKITWRHQIFGIAAAMGSYAAVVTILDTHWLHSFMTREAFDFANMLAYDAMLVTWLVYVSMRVPDEIAPNMLLRPQRWNDALLDATHPSRGPVLLGIEDIVDRTMSRRASEPVRTL